MDSATKKLYECWLLLRGTYGVLFIGVGADKFFNILAQWQQFIGESTYDLLPIPASVFLKVFGAIQILAGVLLFTRLIWTGIFLILALLVVIFINLWTAPASLLVIGHDLSMIAGIIVLWQLTVLHKFQV